MHDRLYKLGGVSFVASGALFLAKNILEIVTGVPPPGGAELVTWVVSRQALFGSTVEIFFFAVMCLVPATWALYESLAASHRSSAVVGCGIIATTIPVMSMLVIVQGRLAFPVFHIEVRSQQTLELLVSLYHGGLHAVALLLVVPTVVLSLAMRRRAYGHYIAALGVVTAAFDVIGSYPWAIGLALWLLSAVLFSAWFVLVGLSLYRTPAAPSVDRR